MLVRLNNGVSLETILEQPTGRVSQENNNKLAVLLHPWSRLGGNMNDHVLHACAEVLKQKGFHLLRFNSRGVGRSSGWASFTGLTEGSDVEALVQHGISTIPNVQSLVILGYSHGSLIATLHPTLPAIPTTHVLISYPLGTRGLLTLFNGTYATKLAELVKHPDAKVLIVYGGQDEFTGADNYGRWAKELSIETKGILQINHVPNATHFWHGSSMDELQTILNGFII